MQKFQLKGNKVWSKNYLLILLISVKIINTFLFIFPDNDDDHDIKHHHHRCDNEDGLTIPPTCNLEDDDLGDDHNHAGDDNGGGECEFPVERK